MAATKKKISKKSVTTAPPPPVDTTPTMISRKRQLRLGFGIFFLLAGVFTCFSIVSYFVTWKADQDMILSSGRVWHFISSDEYTVENWGGRLGAALSHSLVYNGVGIAALAIGIWVTLIGMLMIYGKRMEAIM